MCQITITFLNSCHSSFHFIVTTDFGLEGDLLLQYALHICRAQIGYFLLYATIFRIHRILCKLYSIQLGVAFMGLVSYVYAPPKAGSHTPHVNLMTQITKIMFTQLSLLLTISPT